jgi:TetR/AcrR family transcriptional regulator, transcriptional repressor for nem operon
MHARGRLATEADLDTLALLAALQGGLLLTQIERDTKPLQAALDAMLELIATHSGTTQR